MTLDEATRRLRDAGISSPRVDAELLLAHCLGIERSRLSTVDGPEPPGFAAAVERRANREPLQYIVGRAPFRYVDLAVGPGVFIPRPETELLVDAVLPSLAPASTVVDLCAGSGALAVAIATERPGTHVYAVERSPAALPWLRRNAEPAGVTVIEGDVTDPALLDDLHVDAVVSNPPYVPAGTAVEAEVHADPAEAVFAGPDGLAVIPAVIARAAALLRAGGVLVIEHDGSHGEAVPQLLRAGGVWRDVTAHRDLAGRPRYATAVRAAAL